MTRHDAGFVVWLEQMDQLRVRWATAPRDLKPALLLAGPELGEAEMFLHSRKEDLSAEQRDYIVKSIMHGVQGRLRDREARDRVTRDSFRWWMRFAVTVSIVVTLFAFEFGAINVWHRYWVEPELSKLMTERARSRTAQAPQTVPATTQTPAEKPQKKPKKFFPTGHPEPDDDDPNEPAIEPVKQAQVPPAPTRAVEPAIRLIDLARDRLRHGENEIAVQLALEAILENSATAVIRAGQRVPADALSILIQAQAEKRSSLVEVVPNPELAALQGPPLQLSVFSTDGRRMVIASNDRGARLVDVEAGKEITTQSRARAKTSLTVLSGDGSRLVAANDEDTASLWDAARGELIANFAAHEGQVLAATFSGDGTLVLTGSHDATARLWDARSGKLLATLRGHDSSVLAVAISGDGTRLATASEDKTVRIWSREGREIATLKGHQGPVTSVVFLGGREELLTTSYDGTVRLWQTGKPFESRPLIGQTAPLIGAIPSRDGARVLLIGASDVPEIRDASSGELISRLAQAPVTIRAASFSVDSRTAMTLSWEGLLQVWSVGSGDLLATLNRGEERFESAAFTGSDRHITALGSDQRLAVFPAPVEGVRLVEEARRRFPRCLSKDERGKLNLDGKLPAWCAAENVPPAPTPLE